MHATSATQLHVYLEYDIEELFYNSHFTVGSLLQILNDNSELVNKSRIKLTVYITLVVEATYRSTSPGLSESTAFGGSGFL